MMRKKRDRRGTDDEKADREAAAYVQEIAERMTDVAYRTEHRQPVAPHEVRLSIVSNRDVGRDPATR